jgi:hypothetical protein
MVGVFVTMSIGCGAATATPQVAAKAHDPTSHNHDRGAMMMASNGVVDALLTSHLSSQSGNELDVFVEKAGAPLALTTTSLSARAKLPDGREKLVAFDCAPRDERPTEERDGTCSHFVAKVAWMLPSERLEVHTALPLKSGDIDYRWRSFDPVRYAHYIE